MRWWLLLSMACSPTSVVGTSQAVVFGEDGRQEPHEVDDERHAAIARDQVAVRIVDWAIDRSDPDVPRIVYSRTLGESRNLCEGERFAEQIAPGSCSGTLIDEEHVLTAAHCLDVDECDGSHFWVFGFYRDETGALAPLEADDVYGCTRIVVSSRRDDFAIVELDRPVRGREPVQPRLLPDGLPIGAPLSLIGFPDGIPAKVERSGVVTFSFAGEIFRGTVDAFPSSSGSGVFDDEGRLVGILQRGVPDYVERGDCTVVNVIEGPSEGEVMGYLDEALTAYCDAEPTSQLCACGGPCGVAAVDAGVDAGDAGVDAVDAGVDAMDARMDADSGAVDADLETPVDMSNGGCSATGATHAPWLLLLIVWRRCRAPCTPMT